MLSFSLQATWIRNTIARALRQSTTALIKVVPDGLVYSHSSIASLAAFLSQPVLPASSDVASEEDTKRTAMLALVDKYTQNVPAFTASPNATMPERAVVLVTGTTGGLGTSLLATLLASPTIATVYAVNRTSANVEGLSQRQRQSFIARGLDEKLLDSKTLVLLEADLNEPGLGLSSDVLERVCCLTVSVGARPDV
jgi:hypothetical protein